MANDNPERVQSLSEWRHDANRRFAVSGVVVIVLIVLAYIFPSEGIIFLLLLIGVVSYSGYLSWKATKKYPSKVNKEKSARVHPCTSYQNRLIGFIYPLYTDEICP